MIGCGRIGDAFADSRATLGVYSHAEAYVECPRTQLVAVCDRDASHLQRCSDRWQVPGCHSEASALLAAEGAEIISICTPDETHYELAAAAIAAPATRAVLVEKPLALRAEEARNIVALARERQVLLAVNYPRRYAPAYAELRKNLLVGQYGAAQKITGYYGKGLMHNGTHWLDLARYFFGEVSKAQGFPAADSQAFDSTPDARLEFTSGVTAYLHGCDERHFTIFEMDIVTANGRIRLVDSGQTIEVFHAEESRACPGYRYLQPATVTRDALRDVTLHAVQDLAVCLDEPGRQPCSSGKDAVVALEVAAAIRASVQCGEAVALLPQP
jgi:predicted dehydrogenase